LDYSEDLKRTLEDYVKADIDPLYALLDVFDGRTQPGEN